MDKKDYGRPATDNNNFKPTSDYDSIRKNRDSNRDLDVAEISKKRDVKDFDYAANDKKWYDQWR